MTAPTLTRVQELAPGIHRGIPMREYLAIDALSAERLSWLAKSPRHYRYLIDQPLEEDTEATLRGTAVHMAVLEPECFARLYVEEPDVLQFDTAKPRATKAYKDACAELAAGGVTVLRAEMMRCVRAMAASVLEHPYMALLLRRAQEREVTLVWERDGRRCRGRADMLGDAVMGDLKTTRSLRTFSPHAITYLGYYRKAGWYCDGAERCGLGRIEHFFFPAVESEPPYDCGVFELTDDALTLGRMDCDRLVALLNDCERKDEWPGMFPELQPAHLTDAHAAEIAASEDE